MQKKSLNRYRISWVNSEEVEIMAYSPKAALKELFPNIEFENVARKKKVLFICGDDYTHRVTIPMKYNGPTYRYYKIKVKSS